MSSVHGECAVMKFASTHGPHGTAAQWGLHRVPFRSANPLQWRVADRLQVWESGRVSHEQHDFLQQRSAEQLVVVQLGKKKEDRCFYFMESTVTVRRSGAKNVQRVPRLFSALDKPSLFFPGLEDRVLSKSSDAHIYLHQETCSPFQRWQSAFVSSAS